MAHLDYFRLDGNGKGTIAPFNQAGMDALLGETTVHPRATLSRAANVVLYAVEKGVTLIDADCVKAAAEANTQATMPDLTEGIDGAM